MGASADYNVGRALGVLDKSAVGLMNCGHHLSAGVEGSLARTGIRSFKLALIKSELACPNDERCLGRLAGNVALAVNLCVAAERHSGCEAAFILAKVVNDGHLVLCKRTGLVRADYLRATKGFHRGKLSYNSVSLGHIGNADGENYGNDHRESLGNRRYGKGYGYHKGVNGKRGRNLARSDKLNAKYDNANSENKPSENF